MCINKYKETIVAKKIDKPESKRYVFEKHQSLLNDQVIDELKGNINAVLYHNLLLNT